MRATNIPAEDVQPGDTMSHPISGLVEAVRRADLTVDCETVGLTVWVGGEMVELLTNPGFLVEVQR